MVYILGQQSSYKYKHHDQTKHVEVDRRSTTSYIL